MKKNLKILMGILGIAIQSRIIESLNQDNPCNLSGMKGKQPEKICQYRDLLNMTRIMGNQGYGHNILLFTGKSGTGKTMGAEKLAHNTKLPFFPYSADKIVEDGSQGSHLTQKIFADALAASKENNGRPVIILIDNLDALFIKDKRAYPVFVTELKHELQESFKRRNLIVILTVRDPKILDKALVNRCSLIYWELPDKKDREEIFRMYVENLPHKFNKSFYAWVAKRTNRFSAEDIENIVDRALFYAKMENSFHLLEHHIEKGLQDWIPEVDKKNPGTLKRTLSLGTKAFIVYKTYKSVKQVFNKKSDEENNDESK